MRPTKRLRWLAAAASVAAIALAVPASAAPPPGVFSIGIYESNGKAVKTIARKTLICNPDGGSHPNPAGACRALERTGGALSTLPGRPGPCTKEFRPRIAVVAGQLGNRKVTFAKKYANECVLRNALAPLFDFRT